MSDPFANGFGHSGGGSPGGKTPGFQHDNPALAEARVQKCKWHAGCFAGPRWGSKYGLSVRAKGVQQLRQHVIDWQGWTKCHKDRLRQAGAGGKGTVVTPRLRAGRRACARREYGSLWRRYVQSDEGLDKDLGAPHDRHVKTTIDLAEALIAGDRRALARGITLVESARPDHRADAEALLSAARATGRQALRVGLSGTPGVGKSTFIEAFGMKLADAGKRIAVLAVDPSSARTGGSILGDKTRMERLTRHPNAYIRPSPSQSELGGVARRTREAISLCEAAGFDLVLIETVGVGQSETLVAAMSDVFVLLLAPAGGDELQGVKRGIMEIADLILVNKADGDLEPAARRTAADYAGALRLMRSRDGDPPGFPKVELVSALAETGLDTAWAALEALTEYRRATGFWAQRRAHQARAWFEDELRHALLAELTQNARAFDTIAEAVVTGEMSASGAALAALKALRGKG